MCDDPRSSCDHQQILKREREHWSIRKSWSPLCCTSVLHLCWSRCSIAVQVNQPAVNCQRVYCCRAGRWSARLRMQASMHASCQHACDHEHGPASGTGTPYTPGALPPADFSASVQPLRAAAAVAAESLSSAAIRTYCKLLQWPSKLLGCTPWQK